MKPNLSGSGGSGGGGSSYRTTPDNLRSTDTFEAILGLTTSRARLAGGLKNLFVDGVPVEDVDGFSSFDNFSATLFDGNPLVLEPIKLKLGQSAGPTSVNVSVDNTNTSSPGPFRTAAITQSNCDFIDLRFIIGALYDQNEDGVFEGTASMEIQLRPSGSANWISPLLDNSAPAYTPEGITNDNVLVFALRTAWMGEPGEPSDTWSTNNPNGYLQITGKTTSPYVKELRIAVPNTGAYANKTWQVRVRLIEKSTELYGEDNNNERRRTISWETITGVSSEEFGGTEAWRGLAHISLYGQASNQITGIPEVTGIYELGDPKVPPNTVWNPRTRVYTNGAWDGVTYQKAWTRDPAWQIKALIEDDLSGIAALSPGATLNRWDALEASKWFSEMVDDGQGGTHPRYTLDWFLEQPMQVHELVNYLAGAVGGFCWDEGDGSWRLKVEKPESPAIIFTKENIVGEFVYSNTDWDTRYNEYIGVFRDADNFFKETRVRVADDLDISLTGRRSQTIALVGCTNRQEALRRLQVRLLSSLHETKTVTFTTNRQGGMLEPLSVIAVADGDLNSNTEIRTTTRIFEKRGPRHLKLREPVRLEVGIGYQIQLTLPNNNYDPVSLDEPDASTWRNPTKTVLIGLSNSGADIGDVKDLYLTADLPANTPEFAPFSLYAVGLPSIPKQFRVNGIVPSEDGETVSLFATEIHTSKWGQAEEVSQPDINNPDYGSGAPPPPTNAYVDAELYHSNYGPKRVLNLSWDRPAYNFVAGYRIEYSVNNGPYQVAVDGTPSLLFEVRDPVPGKYAFRIYTKSLNGRRSIPLETSIDIPTIDELLWELISGAGKPEDGATVGAPPGTLVGGVPATTVATAATNLNNLNDFDTSTIPTPTIPGAGVCYDHTLSTDGSANITFEWNWSGDESTIDGFQIIAYQTTASGAYTIGTVIVDETAYTIPPNKRAFALFGVPADKYYTLAVRAYRRVDNSVNSSGLIATAWVKSTVGGENPYRPSASVAFVGNVTGTIFGRSAEDVANTIKPGGGIQNGMIQTLALQAGTVSVTSTAAGTDTFLASGTGATVILTTGWVTVGDAVDGGALVQAFASIDSGAEDDVGGRFYLDLDTGGGFVQAAVSAAGVRVIGGDALFRGPVYVSATAAGISQIRARIRVATMTVPNGADGSGFSQTVRQPQIVIFGGKR